MLPKHIIGPTNIFNLPMPATLHSQLPTLISELLQPTRRASRCETFCPHRCLRRRRRSHQSCCFVILERRDLLGVEAADVVLREPLYRADPSPLGALPRFPALQVQKRSPAARGTAREIRRPMNHPRRRHLRRRCRQARRSELPRCPWALHRFAQGVRT